MIDELASSNRPGLIARDAWSTASNVATDAIRMMTREALDSGLADRSVELLATAIGQTRLSGRALAVGRAFRRT